jgi:hypothetical protein
MPSEIECEPVRTRLPEALVERVPYYLQGDHEGLGDPKFGHPFLPI